MTVFSGAIATLERSRRATMKRAVLLALTAVFVAVAVEAATIQTSPVFVALGGPHAGFPVGDAVPGAQATLIRNEDGVAFIIRTRNLPEGAVTAWLFDFPCDNIANCASIGPPSFGTSDTVGQNGKAHLAFGISEGDGVVDAEADTFVVLILDHGPVDPELIHLHLSTVLEGHPVQTVIVEP
jgi:hypothetical protein